MAVAPLSPRYTTYEDLRRLPEDGHRYELFDGEVHLAPSPETGAYRLAASLHAVERAATSLLPALSIDLSQLFQP